MHLRKSNCTWIERERARENPGRHICHSDWNLVEFQGRFNLVCQVGRHAAHHSTPILLIVWYTSPDLDLKFILCYVVISASPSKAWTTGCNHDNLHLWWSVVVSHGVDTQRDSDCLWGLQDLSFVEIHECDACVGVCVITCKLTYMCNDITKVFLFHLNITQQQSRD